LIPAAALLEEWGACELIAFDVRVPGAMKRLVSEGAARRGQAHVELLDPHHAVLVVRPGGAARADPGKRRAA
jgi:hypothetical protein